MLIRWSKIRTWCRELNWWTPSLWDVMFWSRNSTFKGCLQSLNPESGWCSFLFFYIYTVYKWAQGLGWACCHGEHLFIMTVLLLTVTWRQHVPKTLLSHHTSLTCRLVPLSHVTDLKENSRPWIGLVAHGGSVLLFNSGCHFHFHSALFIL